MLRLGPFEIDHPFVLAPMAGITHSPFRRLMRRHRSALVVSELVSATGIEYAGARTLDLLKFHEEERRVGLQIFGEDQEHLVKACQYVERLGADFVDLNMGCPVPKVVKKGAGSAMCRDPLGLSKILKAMVASVRIPVTIKIRTGWDAQSRNAAEIVKVAGDAGVAWVAIHGRTRAQGYSGDADWDFIGDVKAKSALPIIGNGDVSSAEDAVRRYRTYGVDAVMIGRAALRNPFLFEQAEAVFLGKNPRRPTIDDYLALMREQRDLLEGTFPARLAMVHARKFLAWYSAGFPGCHEYRRKLFTLSDPEVLWAETLEFFERNARERNLDFMSQPFLMGGHG
ncbi:MAG: hypothetical protein RJB38_898 [Pseudomonadota bacterium]|jgi:nifR3 family TIM-barrel protein